MEPKLTVKMGLETLSTKMTKAQALRFGEKRMPTDLKRAGFETVIFTADVEINGWSGYRINYAK